MLNCLYLCSSLNNSIRSKNKYVYFTKSIFIINFLKKLYIEGFIKRVNYSANFKKLRIELKYSYLGTPAFRTIRIFSKPGKLYYISHKSLAKLRTVGVFLVSTSLGILTDAECLKQGIGGVVLCYIN